VPNGTSREREPHVPFMFAFLSQTGTVPAGARELSIFSSSFMFEVTFDGAHIPLRPVGLDPASPNYADELQTYSGEWIGDVSALASKVVELKISSSIPEGRTMLVVDEVTFLPVPQPSTTHRWGL